MADLESFSGSDSGGEGMDPAAFEKFKERMAAAAAQIKAIQAGEQKQRKKEDELVKILARFVKSGTQQDQMLLVIRLLEQNVPAIFIISLLLIDHPEIQLEIGVKLTQLQEGGQQPAAAVATAAAAHPQNQLATPAKAPKLVGAEIAVHNQYVTEDQLPVHIKKTIDYWLMEIARRAEENPRRLLSTILEEKNRVSVSAIQLASIVLRSFLEKESLSMDFDRISKFMGMMLKGILLKLRDKQL